jgi:transposase InsO family protein
MYQSIQTEHLEKPFIPLSWFISSLEVSRNGYYKWLRRQSLPLLPLPCSPEEMELMELRDQIQKIALQFPAYGYRRITHELGRRGYHLNHKHVLRLMREDNLLCLRKRSLFNPMTTDSDHDLAVYPDLTKDLYQNKKLTDINQLWVSDITYIRLPSEFLYLAVIIDVFSRKCIGWNLDDSLETSLTLTALNMAIKSRWHQGLGLKEKKEKLIHHSDRGVQYASSEYVDVLKAHNILISMGRKGEPLDNAFAESFIKTLKAEEVYMYEYESRDEAYCRIFHFIEDVYNKKRLHSALGYLPPDEFEQKLQNLQPIVSILGVS